MKKSLLISFAVALLVSLVPDSSALAGRNVFGIRGGFTDDPDSFFFGGHALIHPRRARALRLEPALELGIGDEAIDFFSIRFNFTLKYLFPLGRDMAVYPLFGPAIYYINADCDGCDDTEVGVHLGGGFDLYGVSLDIALGLTDDIPDFTFTVGYSFW
ncbi:MAG: hypothetical protein MJE77_23590 [Proteobacteria bacterium]|nr:hypothetical protein [Pseudomonadota bacterium]